jgi:hypothetical protein
MDSGMRMKVMPFALIAPCNAAAPRGLPISVHERRGYTCLRTLPRVYNGPRQRARRPVRGSHGGAIVKQTYRVVSGLIALGVVVQASAIAFGWFGALNEVDNGAVLDKNFEGNVGHTIHWLNGMYLMPLLGLSLLIVSFFAAKVVPGARKWGGIVFGLVVLQVVLAFVAFGAPIVGALHGINALLIFGSAARASMLTREATVGRTSEGGAFDVPRQSTGSSAPEASRTVN